MDPTLKHKIDRSWLDGIIAVSAVVISLASLWVAVGEGRTQEHILSASTWPFLQFSTGDVSPSGANEIDFEIQNAGVGPARVRWLALDYHGKAYHTALDAFRDCCGATNEPSGMITSGIQQRVLTATQVVTLVHFPFRHPAAAVWHRLDVERQHFYVRACYCSVLDQCWLLDSRTTQPLRVTDCPPPERPLLYG
ncbi:MAG TPA: hypothetical protein VMF61_15075 [Candidatus Acidoferrales bacterium]|nr:hypothetical protein [Candidatus Acidoferrales bacterium]